MSTADGLLLAIANALSHDVYYKMLDPNAPTGRRLVVSRVLLLFVAIGSAYVASTKPADILSMVAWAFSLAAAGIFPALVLGIWWKRANTAGAIAGMILGFGVCLYYLVGTRYYAVTFHEMWGWLGTASPAALTKYAELKAAFAAAGGDAVKSAAAWKALDTHAQSIASWWGVRNISCALFGLPVGFLSIWIVSLLTPAPSQAVHGHGRRDAPSAWRVDHQGQGRHRRALRPALRKAIQSGALRPALHFASVTHRPKKRRRRVDVRTP